MMVPTHAFMRSTDTIIDKSLATASNGWTNYTIRVVVPVTAMGPLPRGTITLVRAKLFGGASETFSVEAAYIGQQAASGDSYDFSTTPSQLLFSGVGNVIAPMGGSVWSDWVSLTWDKSTPLVYSIDVATGTTTDMTALSVVAGVTSFYKTGNDAATIDATGYTSYSAALIGIGAIEVDGYG